MKLHGNIKINGKMYEKGDEGPWTLYLFFLFHMLMFGLSGFLIAYSDGPSPVPFIYFHGGFAIIVYTIFYLQIFGREEVKWMFVNAALGILGIYTQIDWILMFFGKSAADYPLHIHLVPTLYFILYTFLVRQAVLDLFGAREDEARRKKVEYGYVTLSTVAYLVA
jgi:hypothetical protein